MQKQLFYGLNCCLRWCGKESRKTGLIGAVSPKISRIGVLCWLCCRMRCFALFCGLLRSPLRLLPVWAAIACLYGCMPKPLLAAFYAEYRSPSEFFGCRRPFRGFRWVPAPLFVEFGSENLGCDYSFPEIKVFDRIFCCYACNSLFIYCIMHCFWL